MNKATALAILEVCKEGGYYDDEIPGDDEALIKEAEFYLQHAEAAAETDSADATILKIVELGKASGGYVDESVTPEPAPAPETIAKEHLPIPPQIEGEPPNMPMDISEISDKQVRRLSGEFNACLGRTIWLLSEALTDELHLKSLRDDVYQREFIAAGRRAADAEEKATKDDKEAAAKQTDAFQKINAKVTEAEDIVRRYKALKEVYSGNIDRLSREATLRDDEYRRTGGK
jgi:hypothetical protein